MEGEATARSAILASMGLSLPASVDNNVSGETERVQGSGFKVQGLGFRV